MKGLLRDLAYLGQGSPPEEDGEGVTPIIVLMQFQDLHCVILQEVVQPVGAAVPIQGLPVIPHTVEPQHLQPHACQLTCQPRVSMVLLPAGIHLVAEA